MLDVSDAAAHVIVRIDGVTVCDATYNRDRVTPYTGYSANLIQYVGFGGISNANVDASQPHYSDIVIYAPDSGDLSPIGPLSIDYLPALDAGGVLALPVSDADALEIPGASWSSYAVSKIDAARDDIARNVTSEISVVFHRLSRIW